MKELTIEDKLFFFEKHFFTLDGLWMIEAENKTDWDTALMIDLNVWIKLLKIIFRRLSKYLGIQNNDIIGLVRMLTFRWSIEGWSYDLKVVPNEVLISIKSCPFKAAMDRNPERHEIIGLICKNMCNPFYHTAIHNFNPSLTLKRTKFMGLGANDCDFRISINQPEEFDVEKLIDQIQSQRVKDKDKLYYFEKNFRTMDGLWVIETEEQTDFDTAIELDTTVWERLYTILFKRVNKYLGQSENSLQNLGNILSFLWTCEGMEYEILKFDEEEVIFKVTGCPYIEAMQRNPERQHKIRTICKEMCVKYLDGAVQQYNPTIKIERTQFIGLGDKECDFHLKLKKELIY